MSDSQNRDQASSKRLGPLVTLAAIAMFMDGFDAMVLPLAAPGMMASANIPIPTFALVLMGGQAGVVLGSLLFGALGDRFGRRPMVLLAFAAFTLCTVATPFALSLPVLILVRFVAGVGIGGLKPLLAAFIADRAPPQRRVGAVTTMYLGYGIGAVSVSLASIHVIATFSWQGLFLLAGGLSAIVFLVLVAALPRGDALGIKAGPAAIKAGPAAPKSASGPSPSPAEPAVGRGGTKERFLPKELIWTSCLLSAAFGANATSQTFLGYWIPTLVREAGGTGREAGLMLASYALGGIFGGMLLARILRFFKGDIRPIAAAAALAFLAVATVGSTQYGEVLSYVAIVVAGACLLGINYVLLGVATPFYPSQFLGRGTGICVAAASVGTVVGPWLGGRLIASDLPHTLVMALGGTPLLLVALTSFSLQALQGRAGRGSGGGRPLS